MICSKSKLDPELGKIHLILLENGYPEHAINSAFKLKLQQLNSNPVHTVEKCPISLHLPWIGNVHSLSSSSSSSFEGHPLQARHKQNWGRGFILLLPQTAALPGSDAGSDVIKPASSFVIQNRQTACSMWCPMYGAHC